MQIYRIFKFIYIFNNNPDKYSKYLVMQQFDCNLSSNSCSYVREGSDVLINSLTQVTYLF